MRKKSCQDIYAIHVRSNNVATMLFHLLKLFFSVCLAYVLLYTAIIHRNVIHNMSIYTLSCLYTLIIKTHSWMCFVTVYFFSSFFLFFQGMKVNDVDTHIRKWTLFGCCCIENTFYLYLWRTDYIFPNAIFLWTKIKCKKREFMSFFSSDLLYAVYFCWRISEILKTWRNIYLIILRQNLFSVEFYSVKHHSRLEANKKCKLRITNDCFYIQFWLLYCTADV